MTVQRLGAHVNVFPPPANRPLHYSALQRCAAPACCSRCTTQSSLLGTCAGTCRWAGQRGWVTVVDSLGLADRKFGSRQPCNASRSGCCRLAAPHTAAGGRAPPLTVPFHPYPARCAERGTGRLARAAALRMERALLGRLCVLASVLPAAAVVHATGAVHLPGLPAAGSMLPGACSCFRKSFPALRQRLPAARWLSFRYAAPPVTSIVDYTGGPGAVMCLFGAALAVAAALQAGMVSCGRR